MEFNSGHTSEELDDYLLDQLFEIEQKSGTENRDSQTENPDNVPGVEDSFVHDDQETERKDSWLPRGWMAYRLFGPTGDVDHQIDLLSKKMSEDINRKSPRQAAKACITC